MVGAYQEILGDMHNLFGDTHSINIRRDPEGGYELMDAEPGDTVEDMLRYVHFHPRRLMTECRKKIGRSGLPDTSRRLLNATLSAALGEYSYLNNE